MQHVLDVSKRKREPYVHHDGQADDLGAGLEVAEKAVLDRRCMLGQHRQGLWLGRRFSHTVGSSDSDRRRIFFHPADGSASQGFDKAAATSSGEDFNIVL